MPYHRFTAGDVVAITPGKLPPTQAEMDSGAVLDGVVLQRYACLALGVFKEKVKKTEGRPPETLLHGCPNRLASIPVYREDSVRGA